MVPEAGLTGKKKTLAIHVNSNLTEETGIHVSLQNFSEQVSSKHCNKTKW